MHANIDPLDQAVEGAEAIAHVLGLLRDDGTPNLRRTFYVLEKGYADADKRGRIWASTPRRLLNLPRANNE
jgi:hypothetical protein